MKYGLLLSLFVFFGCSSPTSAPSNKLVVMISIDQVYHDVFYAGEQNFTGGFARLHTEGKNFSNTFHYHAYTATATGHATLATGYYPRNHGIPYNYIYNEAKEKIEYAVLDTTVHIVGVDSSKERTVSPNRLEKLALGDYVKKHNPKSKSYSLSTKDRSAILMGGKNPNGVYWYDQESTQMITSSYYSSELPEYIKAIKADEVMADSIQNGWNYYGANPCFPIGDSLAEEAYYFTSYFPHTLQSVDSARNEGIGKYIKYTPFGDQFLLHFAKELIQHEAIGQDEHPDVLCIGLSASDEIGHHFGPKSYEVEDYLHRMDQQLGLFFDFLDRTVGKDQYAVVLTSDHGTCPFPERNARGYRIPRKQFRSEMDSLIHHFQVTEKLSMSPVDYYTYSGMEPNWDCLEHSTLDSQSLVTELCSMINKLPYIVNTVNGFDLRSHEGNDSLTTHFWNNYHPKNSLFIGWTPEEYCLIGMGNGTNHATAHSYDTSVPLLIMGNGISSGTYSQKFTSASIVPTVLNYLGINPSENFDGTAVPLVIN